MFFRKTENYFRERTEGFQRDGKVFGICKLKKKKLFKEFSLEKSLIETPQKYGE